MNFLVLSIRKYFLTFIFILFTISLIAFSSTNFIAAQNGLALFATSVFPTLFPFFIATELLLKTNIIHVLGKFLNKFMRPVFNVPGESAIAIILGTISGYPVGAKIVCNLKEKKIISKIESERLISFTNNSGPLFILGTVGIALFGNKKIGIILLTAHIFSALTVGYIFKFWKKDKFQIENFNKIQSSNKLIKVSELGEIIGESIKNATSTILTIGGFIVLFSVVISILKSSKLIELLQIVLLNFGISETLSYGIITGFIEITNGIHHISTLYQEIPTLSILLTSFILGFGGISVLFQVFSIISKQHISIKPYILGKLLHGLISVIYTYILL